MKFQALFALALSLVSTLSFASESRLVETCRSQGRYQGGYIFMDLLQVGTNSYRAIISETRDLATVKNKLVDVTGISMSRASFPADHALTNGNGFELYTTPGDRQSQTVTYVANGKRHQVALWCDLQ